MFTVERRKDFRRREEFERALRRNVDTRHGVMLYESVLGESAETRRLMSDLDGMVEFYSEVLYGREIR